MKRTEFNGIECANERPERPAAGRRFAVRGVAIAGAVGFALGCWAGNQFGPVLGPKGAGTLPPARDEVDAADAGPGPQLVEQYRRESIRLARARGEQAAVLREKQLTLQILQARGVGRDAPACRRLEREVGALQARIAGDDDRLARLREQLAQLTAVTSAADAPPGGLDVQTEIEARRVILEHDAGLPAK